MMKLFVLITLALGVHGGFSGPFPGISVVSNTPGLTPGGNVTGSIVFLGTFGGVDPCVAAALALNSATAYTWHDQTVTDGWAGQCFARVDGQWKPAGGSAGHFSGQSDDGWLRQTTSDLLFKCQITSQITGGPLYTPDASASYGAQWTRDFAYMVDYAGDLMNLTTLQSAVLATLAGMRHDGCMPDRVQSNGQAVYGPGPAPGWTDHAWDNQAFAGILVAAYVRAAQPPPTFFCSVEPQLAKAMAFQNISAETGLIFNDEVNPNCTYGFTDTVRKTGNLLFTSLVTYDAAGRLGKLASQYQCGNVTNYAIIQQRIRIGLETLFDAPSGMYLAASSECRQIDVWGSLYAASLEGLLSPSRAAGIASFVARNAANIFSRGQVRHLVAPEVWQGCFNGGCPAPGTYQNGAYWATPHGWGLPVLALYGQAALASSLYNATLADFMANGVMEDVNVGYHGVVSYVASATNLYGAMKVLSKR